MESKTESQIETICLCGHVDVGKSTFAGKLLSRGTYRNGEEICEDISAEYSKELDILGEFKEKGKGATHNYTCNELMINEQIYCIIDNPGHLEYLWEVARSLELADTLILMCQADRLNVSMAYCKLIKYMAKSFDNITKTILLVNKIDLHPELDISKLQEEIQVDLVLTHSVHDEDLDDILANMATVKAEECDELIAFDEDIGGKDNILYMKTLSNMVMQKDSQIEYGGNVLHDIISFSDKEYSPYLMAGEYFTAKIKKNENNQMGSEFGTPLPMEFDVRGKINRKGVLFSVEKYIGYVNYQYFECLVRGPDTLKLEESQEELHFSVIVESHDPLYVDSDSKIILFNRANITNPLIFMGCVE